MIEAESNDGGSFSVSREKGRPREDDGPSGDYSSASTTSPRSALAAVMIFSCSAPGTMS